MPDSLRALLPSLYNAFLPDFFDTPAPVEAKATCDNCAMCPPKDAPSPASSPDVTFFRPDAKCCTYHPRLPNYLVGAILADERPDMQEGQRRIRAKIAARTGVSPRWIAPPPKFEVVLRAAYRRSFGRSLVLLCPYFERSSGLCTIWRQREIVCSTFFCKYVDGIDGEHFWKSVRGLVGYIERELSQEAARQVIPGYADPPDLGLTVEDLEDRPPSDVDYTASWGEWAGREEELYLGTYAWVQSLDRARFEAIVRGPSYDERFRAAKEAHRALIDPTLPPRLTPNPMMDVRPAQGGVLVTTYNRYEPLLLNDALYEVVREFSPGETVAEVRARLARDAGIDVPEELLVSMTRFRILVAPS